MPSGASALLNLSRRRLPLCLQQCRSPTTARVLRHSPPIRPRLYSTSTLPQHSSTSWRRIAAYTAGAGAAVSLAVVYGLPIIQADSGPTTVTVKDDGYVEIYKTTEQQMLEISEAERKAAHHVSRGIPRERRALKRVELFVFDYIVEPFATGLRFVTLVGIFMPVIMTIPVMWLGRKVGEEGEREGTVWWYGFLVKSLERAGPTFIKLGQWAASRSDVFPASLCELMSKLHSNAKAHSLSQTKAIVTAAFNGLPFEDVFEEFDDTPLGVGAIAQVYKAKLKHDLVPRPSKDVKDFRESLRETVDGLVKLTPGARAPTDYVAVKVVHPRVDKTVNRDLRIMKFFALALNSIPSFEWFSFPGEVDVFADMMRLQMDLRIEAENLAKFRENFKGRSTVTFPMPYREWTTRDVLIEEFAEGIPLSKFLEKGAGIYQEGIANMGLDAFLHMLVLDNFIHSDLHPGNIMIRFVLPPPTPFFSLTTSALPIDATSEASALLLSPRTSASLDSWNDCLAKFNERNYRPQLVFLDTGLVTELNPVNRKNFLDLFRSIAEFDGYRAGQLMISRSRSPETVIDPEVFALKVQHLVLEVKSRTLALGNISFGDIFGGVLGMVRTHHVRMEGDFINVILSMLLLEGIGRTLDPEMDLLKSSLPMLRAVGAGSGKDMLTRVGEGGEGDGVSVWSLLKVWAALEARQFVTATVKEIEGLVKYDQLSPNI